MTATPRTSCRICDNADLRAVLDLGSMPLANRLLTHEQLAYNEPHFPLMLNFCDKCGLVQLSHVVAAEALYTDYPFLTASSKVMVEHFGRLMVENAHKYVPQDGLVVEIGSNDGSALSALRDRPVRVLGVDPALNIDAGDVPTERAFFDSETAKRIVQYNGPAHLIVACNVLAHVDDVHEFLRGARALLHPEGAIVIEVPELHAMLSAGAYSQIYHEHLSYFGFDAIQNLLERHGLYPIKVESFPVHGGTMRVTATVNAYAEYDRIVRTPPAMMDELEAFAHDAERQRRELIKQLTTIKLAGRFNIIGYGASAKGAIVLNYCGVGRDLVHAVLDNTPAKQFRYMPGTRQEIFPPLATLNMSLYDAILLLAWNHRAEIEAKLKAAGFTGKIIVPHG